MTLWLWVIFFIFVLVMLSLDLFVVNRKPHAIKTREALAWTGLCVALGLAFNVLVYFLYANNWLGVGERYAEAHDGATGAELGKHAATVFFSGWLVEYSLSMDNIFVMAVIFNHFQVNPKYQHRVLFWGILGALILRGVMIGIGSELVNHFHFVLYIFGAILVYTGIRLAFQKESDLDPEQGWVYRWARKTLPMASGYDGDRFFIRENGRWVATGLFLVLLVVETTDVVFAIDSIPAIFVITKDPFIVFTSNVFAILGLRSLYFALAVLMDKFQYLKYSLAFVLAFVGLKMLLSELINARFQWKMSPTIALVVIATALASGVAVSLLKSRHRAEPAPGHRDTPGT